MKTSVQDKNIYTEINGSEVSISFIDSSDKSATDSIFSVFSAIYGNRLKSELCNFEKINTNQI